jgi:segregation and condensation protein A
MPSDLLTPESRLNVELDGFEGPLDLLLDLARAQKIDLARMSILSLVEQYLEIFEGAGHVRLELAADWLVMAAWLTWLKSRLLLPAGTEAAEEGELAAGSLAARLAALLEVRAAAAWLSGRAQLGHDVFARGQPEDFAELDRSRLALDLPSLVRAYVAALRRRAGRIRYTLRPVTFWSVQDAIGRLQLLLGQMPDWSSLERFLPESLPDPMARRAATASTLLAGLELARVGFVQLRQEQAFGPILVRRGKAS